MKLQRQLPRWKNVKPLLGWTLPKFTRADKALARCITIQDLRKLSMNRVPKAVFDYVDGGANEEISISRSKNAFSRIEFRPQILRDVSKVDLSRTILGERMSSPVIFAPTGYTRMMHYTGEIAVASVAAAHNMVYALSTMGTVSVEELAETIPDVHRWFQLYMWSDRDRCQVMIDRARDAGFSALILTVDTAVPGQHNRDIRNGLTIPPKINARTFLNMSTKVKWWFNLLTTPPLEFATLRSEGKSPADAAARVFDSSVTFEDILWLKSIWNKPIIVKGVQSVEDAQQLAKIGIEAIVISNHGGRQLDGGTVPLEVLPQIVDAVGDKMQIFLDGGIMSGRDVLAAIGLGADAVLIGRAYLYGAMAAGSAGIEKMLSILTTEMQSTLQLNGVTSVDGFTSEFVRLREHE
jgi:L-lactate dehydrogenase (cytochrome)